MPEASTRVLSPVDREVLAIAAKAGTWIQIPEGLGKAAFTLFRDGYLKRRRKRRRGGSVAFYRIRPLAPLPEIPATERIHRCQAIGCTAAVDPRFLMCGRHWAMVPTTIHTELQAHGRGERAWVEAADAAILLVARKEQRRGPIL